MVYAGTPEFAVPALEALLASQHSVVAVYTQPDRPAGRGRRLKASPVKACAQAHQIPLEQPASLRDPEAQSTLASYAPDVMVVAAYGLILPASVLAIPHKGCVNIHASLLPRWRGAAPIQRAIQAGDAQTGVCLMEMAQGLDTGAVVAEASTPISPTDTAASVHDRLAAMGATLLTERLSAWASGQQSAQPQPNEGVTYAEKITSAEAWIDWQRSASALDRLIRAFNPWPVARCHWRGEALRILAAEVVSEHSDGQPGEVIAIDPNGLTIATGTGALRLTQVQVPGRRVQSASDFQRGAGIHVGQHIE